jgi:formate hydrogenlyase subunit 4
MAREHLSTGSTFEQEVGSSRAVTMMVVGLADPRMRIEVEVTARRRGS